MAVRPLPRQSTMPLLQLHMAGQEPEERVQAGARAASPWPAKTGGVMSESHTLLRPLPLQICCWEGAYLQELPRGARTRERT